MKEWTLWLAFTISMVQGISISTDYSTNFRIHFNGFCLVSGRQWPRDIWILPGSSWANLFLIHSQFCSVEIPNRYYQISSSWKKDFSFLSKLTFGLNGYNKIFLPSPYSWDFNCMLTRPPFANVYTYPHFHFPQEKHITCPNEYRTLFHRSRN